MKTTKKENGMMEDRQIKIRILQLICFDYHLDEYESSYYNGVKLSQELSISKYKARKILKELWLDGLINKNKGGWIDEDTGETKGGYCFYSATDKGDDYLSNIHKEEEGAE